MKRKAQKAKSVNPHLIAAGKLELRREQMGLLAKPEPLKLWKYLNMRKGATFPEIQKASGWNAAKAKTIIAELQEAKLARESGGKIFPTPIFIVF